MNTQKQMKAEDLDKTFYLDLNSFEGPLQDTIDLLKGIIARGAELGYSNISLNIHCYEGASIHIEGERLETDKELEKRLLISKKVKEAKKITAKKKEDEERLQYERLKAKFERNSQ